MRLKSRKLIRLENEIPVYCMTVPGNRNFAVQGHNKNRDSKSVFAHNCDSDPD